MSDTKEKNDAINASVAVGRKTLKLNPKKRKKITRRKPGTKPTKRYFTNDTQDAIIRYQNSNIQVEKDSIYVQEILPAFDALVENLINVYGFKVMHESKQDLKSECLEFLYTAVHKFDPEKGSKAFSYFNVVAKNWLTIKSKQNAKKVKQYVSLDYQEGMSQTDLEQIECHNLIPGFDDVMTSQEMNQFLRDIVDELEKRTKTDNEKSTIDAIKVIINKLDDIDLLSKRAILLYIREITGLSSKQLSIVISSLKKHYRELRKTEEFSY